MTDPCSCVWAVEEGLYPGLIRLFLRMAFQNCSLFWEQLPGHITRVFSRITVWKGLCLCLGRPVKRPANMFPFEFVGILVMSGLNDRQNRYKDYSTLKTTKKKISKNITNHSQMNHELNDLLSLKIFIVRHCNYSRQKKTQTLVCGLQCTSFVLHPQIFQMDFFATK